MGTAEAVGQDAIQFRLRVVRGGHDVDDYEDDAGEARVLEAWLFGQKIGQVTYNLVTEELTSVLTETVVRLRWVETGAAWRRQGIATTLLRELVRRHPGAVLVTAGATPAGERFLEAWQRRSQVQVIQG